jgi:hypothetical protein
MHPISPILSVPTLPVSYDLGSVAFIQAAKNPYSGVRKIRFAHEPTNSDIRISNSELDLCPKISQQTGMTEKQPLQ